jgi:hypothetical protein
MLLHQVPFDAEEFWDDLLAFIEEGRVIPVVGTELLTIEENGHTVPLYRAVAERLLARYGLDPAGLPDDATLRPHHELNDSVSALAAAGKRVKDLYRPIHDILQQLLASQEQPLPALRELASIRHFDLFATTTPEGLLARALAQETARTEGMTQLEEIEYAPSLPTDRRRDIPELRPPDYRAVFYMFGKLDVSPFYAIHDEDVLEFAYTLQYTVQNGVPPVRMFSELRSRNLLLIGCNFADWLSRFFLRLSNEKRLSSDERPKKEFLVDQAIGQDGNLTVFLERFSRDSRCYPMPAREFVAELYRRWQHRNPDSGAVPKPSPAPGRPSALGGGSVFISYASEDLAAARRLSEEVRQVGGDVVWLDKGALRPGDDWNRQILSAVQRCDLFLPLISATTEQRTEGYFRLEWNEAAERSRRIHGRKFIFPTVIDPEVGGGMSRYVLVPEAFKQFQFDHSPGGQLSSALRAEITEQLRHLRRGRVA